MNAGLVPADEIETFFADGWIDEVLFAVKSGKEAAVYCCKAAPGRGESHYALKVYKGRQLRNFRNASVYQEGRAMGKSRAVRAFKNKSRFGRAVEHGNWIGQEFRILRMLHEAGAAVPQTFAISDNAILLSFVGKNGCPAPQLSAMRLSPHDAELLLERALRTVEIMMTNNVVHGDLSAYNMLVTDGRLMVIDFPQAVDARTNGNAKSMLIRDVNNLCRYFAAQGAEAEPGSFAEDLWQMYESAKL